MRPAAGEALPPPQDDAQATLLLSAGGPERALARPWARWAAALCAAAAAAPAAAAAARCLRGGAPEGVVLAAAAALAAATTTTQPFARGDYQAAIDFLPVTTLVYYRWTHSKEEPTRKLPALIRKFDMLFGMDELVDGWDPLPAPPKDVRTILCIPWAPGRLLEWVKVHLDDSDNNRTVVFSGRESPLSEAWGWQDSNRWNEMTEQYSKYFKRIYFYVTDVELEGVDTMPIGFTESYMQGRTDSFLDAWTQASTKDTRKVHSVLAAWGKYTALGGKHLVPGSNSPGGEGGLASAWTRVANHAIDIRNDASGWSDTPEAKAAGVQRRYIEKDQWWTELSKYKFIMVPLGSAIQCSKVPEALSMLTIPVIKRGPYRTHDDLVRMGFPIVLVEAWADITPEATQRWWRSLSPVLLSFRERCLSTEGYWRLLTQGGCMPPDAVSPQSTRRRSRSGTGGSPGRSAHLASAVGSREDGGNLTAPSAAPARPVA